MAARVTATEVKAIFDTDLDDTVIDVHITSANLVVNQQIASESCMTTDLLKQIELYLSAHFAAVTDPSQTLSEEKAGESTSKYQGKTDMGLDSTMYGQRAKLLDCSGKLSTIGKTRAVIEVIETQAS